MTDKEVLQKAIEKAIENGLWKTIHKEQIFVNDFWNESTCKVRIMGGAAQGIDFQAIIFSHDFARAFFPKDERPSFLKVNEVPKYYHDFEGHLMAMILESNPIDYLRKFI